METIGFATEYYTLWCVSTEQTYFQDAYGTAHVTGEKTNYHYCKNISTDLEKVKTLFPNTPIDEELRGKSADFFTFEEKDTTPHILKFGKHKGFAIYEICEKDFQYALWLSTDCNNFETRKLINEIPAVKAHYDAIEEEKQKARNALPVAHSGLVTLTFKTNPNRLGVELYFINENRFEFKNVPSTLQWETKNTRSNGGKSDWLLIETAESAYSLFDNGFSISTYLNGGKFTLNGTGDRSIKAFNTIEEARSAAELHILEQKDMLHTVKVDTQYTKYAHLHYAEATIGDGNIIYVFFNEVKSVNGMYPYNMGIINGKAMKLKGKKIALNLNIFNTIKYDNNAQQYAIIN